MIKVTEVLTKEIKDPLFSSIKRYMQKRVDEIFQSGDQEKIDLAKTRYTGLRWMDVQIEPPIKYPNGSTRACFLSRKTGFFHADAEIEVISFHTVLNDMEVIVPVLNRNDLVSGIEGKTITSGLYHLQDTDEHVIVIKEDEETPDDVQKLIGSIYWDSIAVNRSDSMDVLTKRSGEVTVTSACILDTVIPIYYPVHVIAAK